MAGSPDYKEPLLSTGKLKPRPDTAVHQPAPHAHCVPLRQKTSQHEEDSREDRPRVKGLLRHAFSRGALAVRPWELGTLLQGALAVRLLVGTSEDHQPEGRSGRKNQLVPVQQQSKGRVPDGPGQ